MYVVGMVAAVLFPAAAFAQGQRPDASFSFSPENPRTGDQVRFESSSCNPEGRLVRQAWDLDGDGDFDDAEGPVAGRAFSGSGSHVIGLQVTNTEGTTDVERRVIMVNTEYALPQPDSARLMSPFPVVTLAGQLTPQGARIKLLAVRAPVCARVTVSCRGAGCRVKRTSEYAGRKRLRVHRFERRLRAGAVLTVRVSKGRLIGKFTTFRVRKGAPPQRRDMCLRPGQTAGSRCPRG